MFGRIILGLVFGFGFCLAFGLGKSDVGCRSNPDCASVPFSYCDLTQTQSCTCVPGYVAYPPNSATVLSCRKGSLDQPGCGQYLPLASANDFCAAGVQNSVCDIGSSRCVCALHYQQKRNVLGYAYCERTAAGSTCKPGLEGDDKCRSALQVQSAFCHPTSCVCSCPAGYQYVGIVSGMELHKCVVAVSGDSQPLCKACIETGGVCFVNTNGDIDCACPASKSTSVGQNWESVGCDKIYADIGEQCTKNRHVECRDAHAQCVHAGLLDYIFQCECCLGYVAITNPHNPTKKICVRDISRVRDPNCQTCYDNGGICYGYAPPMICPDNQLSCDRKPDHYRAVMQGCVCPEHKSSSDYMNPNKVCDISHVNVTCSAHAMKVCYNPHDSDRYPNVANELLKGKAKMYIEHHPNDVKCHFQPNSVTGEWCIELDLRNVDRCGVIVNHPTRRTISFNSVFIVQRQRYQITCKDFSFCVYCIFDTIVDICTGLVDVSSKFTASHGISVSPELVMTIEDDYNRDISGLKGVTIGHKIRLVIEMTQDRNVYNSLQAIVCMASNSPTLKNVLGTKSCLLVFDGCVIKNPYFTKMSNFNPDPTDPRIIRTGYFPVFKFFDTDRVFFHCAVKVCRKQNYCYKPCNCTDTTTRRRRSVDSFDHIDTSAHPVIVPSTLDSDHHMISWQHAVDADQIIEAEKIYSDPQYEQQTVGIRIIKDEYEGEIYHENQEHVEPSRMLSDGETYPERRLHYGTGNQEASSEENDYVTKSVILFLAIIVTAALAFVIAGVVYFKVCSPKP